MKRSFIFQICVGYLCLTFPNVWRLIYLTSSGQHLISCIDKSRWLLEDDIVKRGLERDLEQTWFILRSRLDHRTPITPGSAFGLSNKGLIAVVSTLLTYMIVLIQFKLSGS